MAKRRLPNIKVNDTFGRLRVTRGPIHVFGRWMVECVCSCSAPATVCARSLIIGRTRSCGCLRVDATRANKRRHGMTDTPTHISWMAMHQRCADARRDNHKWYGGRGITVCDRLGVFENFLADMGERPIGKTLDRINNDGHYAPENCRWATQKQHVRNGRLARIIESDGQRMCIVEWSETSGVARSTIQQRLSNGWDPDDAIWTPARAKRGTCWTECRIEGRT